MNEEIIIIISLANRFKVYRPCNVDQPSPPPPPPPPITQYKVLIFLTFYLWHYTTISFILFNIFLYSNWFEANRGGTPANGQTTNVFVDDDVQTNKTLFWKVIHRCRNNFFSSFFRMAYMANKPASQPVPGAQCNEIGEQGAHTTTQMTAILPIY